MSVERGTATNYISTITGVREVALTGAADLAYWREQLRPARLSPFDDNGRASLLLTAIDANFRGIPFRELSIAVRLQDGAAYLVQAFNSSRLLALAERLFFQTPYHLADLAVDERPPASFTLSLDGGALFSARMGTNSTPALRDDALWQGAIYLLGGDKLFYARLSGAAAIYPFAAADDVTIAPPAGENIFRQLAESGFVGVEWLARAGAVHARSRTFRREPATLGMW